MMVSSLAIRLVELLSAQGCTCCTAESCTGGGIGNAITGVPGSSSVFAGGVIAYSNDVKREVLKVRRETLDLFGAVSGQTAAEMAEGARTLLKTDYAVSVTGIAGPGGGSPEKPVGLVWFGVSSRAGTLSVEKRFDGDRSAVRSSAVEAALELLADWIRTH